jgi:hypothetical protein
MKTKNTVPVSRILRLVLLGALALGLTTTTAFAQGTTAFTYQGRLNDGASPAIGVYDVQFTIYDAASGGNAVAGPITRSPVEIINGLFTTTLDFGASVLTGDARWLGIAVKTNGAATFTALTPRQPLTPTPYSLFASNTAKLGGQAPSAFAPAAGSGAYVAKNGDTMTGVLNLPANGLVAGSGQLTLANGNVGIGTTSPQAALHVVPRTPFDGIDIGDDATTGATGLGITLSSLTNGYADIQAVRGQGLAWGDIVLNRYGGNVGIGTTNPTERLDLGENGNVRIAANPGDDVIPANVGYKLAARAAGGGENEWAIWTAAVGGGYGIPPNSFSVWQYPPSGNPSTLERFTILPAPAGQGADPVIIDAYGRVGIGTATPAARLDVNGTVRASGVISAVGGLVIENRTSDPPSPAVGQIWLRTDL